MRSSKGSIRERTTGKQGNTIFFWRIHHAPETIISPPAGGGVPGAQGKDLPQPGAPGKTVIGVSLDHGEGEERGAPAGGQVTQYRIACPGRPPIEAPKSSRADSAKFGDLRRQSTGNGAGGHHGRNGGNSGTTTAGISGAGRGGIHQPAILAAAVWGGETGTTEDC